MHMLRKKERERERERLTYLLLSRYLVLDVQLNCSVIDLFEEELHSISGPVFIRRWNNTGKVVLLGLGGGAGLERGRATLKIARYWTKHYTHTYASMYEYLWKSP